MRTQRARSARSTATTSGLDIKVLDIDALPPGDYFYSVLAFNGYDGPTAPYTLSQYLFGATLDQGGLRVTPTTLQGTPVCRSSCGPRSGLNPSKRYLAVLEYGDTGDTTELTVE